MIPELAALLEMHDQGTTVSAGEVVSEAVALIPRYGVTALLTEMPQHWRRALATWLVEAYDNAIPVDEFVSIQNPEWREQIHAARDWMKTDPSYREDVVDDIAALLAMTDDQLFSRQDLMHQLVRLSAQRGTELVVRELPSLRRQEFIDWAKGNVPADDAIAAPRQGMIEVRDWLRSTCRDEGL